MAFELMKYWARDDAILTFKTPALTVTLQQVFPNDPTRFAFIVPCSFALNVGVGFGIIAPTNEVIVCQQTGSNIILLEDELGDFITQPIWMRISSGTGNLQCFTISYNPERQRVFNAFIDAYVSQYRTPGTPRPGPGVP